MAVSEPSHAEAPNHGVGCSQTAKMTRDDAFGVFVDYGFPKGSLYHIGVVDLDDKSHKTLQHYFEYDADIVNAFCSIHHQA
ncbi:unnamed protein product [Phytomonas sp. EM1]|nr:unnamed protein product [Phytomonas sp. EM1]|eukprot:CCW60761.1 unnamed protein product [Phytomonas sp. isolate EM1]